MDTPSKIAYSVTADSTGGRAGTSSVPALGISHVMRMPKELGIDTKDSVVRTTIGLGPEGDSFALTADIKVFIPGVELDRAQALVERAHELCPYSKATRGNVPVTVTAVANL